MCTHPVRFFAGAGAGAASTLDFQRSITLALGPSVGAAAGTGGSFGGIARSLLVCLRGLMRWRRLRLS